MLVYSSYYTIKRLPAIYLEICQPTVLFLVTLGWSPVNREFDVCCYMGRWGNSQVATLLYFTGRYSCMVSMDQASSLSWRNFILMPTNEEELYRAIARIRYKHGADVMVIVIDSTEDDYTATIAELFKEFLQEESMKDAIFLVLANKQDVEGARSVEQVATELDFHEVTRSHVANIIGCSAKTGEGMQEAMDWLASSLEAKTERVTDIHKDEKPGKKSPSVVSCVKGGYHAVKSLLNR